MSQCVPSWDLDDHPNYSRNSLRSLPNSTTAPDVPMLDYEVAELTWENGQLAMHGLGPPRALSKPVNNTSPTKYAWEKPRASGTLESIVNQATSLPQRKPRLDNGSNDELAPWFNQQRVAVTAAAASATTTMDALVPCSNRSEDRPTQVKDPVPRVCVGNRVVDCSTRVGSCSGPVATHDEELSLTRKRARVARVPVAPEWSNRDHSVTGSATIERESQHMTHDTYDMEMGLRFTSTSMGSPENTSSAKHGIKATTTDDHDSVCHSRPPRDAGDEGNNKKKGNGKSSVSTKRSRAAAIHNQSERKRRDKISQRMKTLQKLVPNSSKTDKASILDEVIEYMKQLQAQVQMMSRMSIPHIMLPMTMQQQLQMSMMAPMGMGMGMGMGMRMGMGVFDMNNINRPSVPQVLQNPFLPMTSWDGSGDPLSTFLACQSQPMTMDAYSRMAAMYQQMQQPPASSSKS